MIHPRIQTDYYKNTPNWDVFEVAYKESKNPICYNGDINCRSDLNQLSEQFAKLETVMIGRGVIHNPGLVNWMENGKTLSKDVLRAFHDLILEEYIQISSGDRNVLFKMKELWFYMLSLFENAEKIGKKIKKTERLNEYEAIINSLFGTCELRKEI